MKLASLRQLKQMAPVSSPEETEQDSSELSQIPSQDLIQELAARKLLSSSQASSLMAKCEAEY